jgi:protein O-mannosyl-transferase
MMTAEPPAGRATWPKAVPLLVLAGLVAYANSFTKAFVLDDAAWITNNADLGDTGRYLRAMGRPVAGLSILVNHRLGGLNPAGYHAFNLAVHVLAGLTLYGLVRRVLLVPRFAGRYGDTAPYLAFAVALLWLVHPLQTQSVTYVIQRCESMMGLFYLFALYAWTRAATGGVRLWYAAAVASFALSCGCKEVAVTLPLVLLAFDRVFLARTWRELARERWLPYLGILAVWGVALQPMIQMALGGGAATGIGFEIRSATPFQYLLTQSEVILHYLRLSFWPVGQTIDYLDWPVAKSVGEVWPALLAVGALLLVSLVLLVVRPAAGFVGFWFFAILAPTSSVMPIIDPAFEHRMYLSLAAVVVGVVFAAEALVRAARWPDRVKAVAAGAAIAAVAVPLVVLTFARNETYRTQLASLEDNARKRPNNPRPVASVAAIHLNARDPDPAGEALDRAERIPGPFAGGVQPQRAAWLALVGRLDEAEQLYRGLARAEYNPYASPTIVRNFAWLLIARGKADEAAAEARSLVGHQPHVAENHLLLAAAELAAGREGAARAAAAEAARLDLAAPRAAAREARGFVFAPESPAAALTTPRAMWLAAAACLADGDRDPMLLDTLAMACARNGQYARAADAARRGVAAAEARGDADWTAALRTRLALYEAGKPYAKGN